MPRCVLLREANAVTDNPLVFADDGDDALRRQLPRRAGGAGRRRDGLAIAEVGAIAERRIAMLIDTSVSRLPPFLTRRRRA